MKGESAEENRAVRDWMDACLQAHDDWAQDTTPRGMLWKKERIAPSAQHAERGDTRSAQEHEMGATDAMMAPAQQPWSHSNEHVSVYVIRIVSTPISSSHSALLPKRRGKPRVCRRRATGTLQEQDGRMRLCRHEERLEHSSSFVFSDAGCSRWICHRGRDLPAERAVQAKCKGLLHFRDTVTHPAPSALGPPDTRVCIAASSTSNVFFPFGVSIDHPTHKRRGSHPPDL